MIRESTSVALAKTHYDTLPYDDSYYGEIADFKGVYTNTDTLAECRNLLEEVLKEWLLLRISRNLAVPVVNGLDLRIKQIA